jgi:hypothetical protein
MFVLPMQQIWGADTLPVGCLLQKGPSRVYSR